MSNQHSSRRKVLLGILASVRRFIAIGHVKTARDWLAYFWREHGAAPASTRRRWRCGR